jgi:putative ABC transport system permease protein
LLAGEWVTAVDFNRVPNAVIVNTEFLRHENDVGVGDTITLKVKGRDTEWQVAGIVRGVLIGPYIYAEHGYLARTIREVDRASRVNIVTEQGDPATQQRVALALEEQYKQAGLRVTLTRTTADLRQLIQSQFDLLITFMLMMAFILAVVGGLGLMGTMSINVLERTREIGVMRAIGASDRAVLNIVLVEGIFIGLLSWLLGALLSLPLSKLLSDAVGLAFVRSPLSYSFSVPGVLIWLGIVIVLAAVASFLPARKAARLTVREVLAYE